MIDLPIDYLVWRWGWTILRDGEVAGRIRHRWIGYALAIDGHTFAGGAREMIFPTLASAKATAEEILRKRAAA